MKIFLSLFLSFSLVIPYVYADQVETTYEIPDVKEAFCGVHISSQYCKCAFHNQCGGELNSDEAYKFVLSEFREWNRDQIQGMGESCILYDGHWNRSTWTCTRCDGGDERVGARCIAPEKVDPEVTECKLAEQEFSRNWEKFSDFDERIPLGEASYEVQEYDRVLTEIAEMINEIHQLEADMVLAAEYRKELRAYKQALVKDLKTNLLKAFWRLSYITYKTIDAGKGAQETFSKAINPENLAEGIGAGLKTIQAHIPGHAKSLQFNTASTSGQVGSILWNSGIEALESVADPKAVATQFIKDVRGAAIGGPDLSPEEIAILKTQHLDNKAVDEALAQSYAESTAMRGQIWTLEASIANKYNELQEWKAKEYVRVQEGLLQQCGDKLD